MQQRYALVTGAASGLGLALCRQLREEGWQVAMADIEEEQLRLAEQTLQSLPGAGISCRLNVTDIEDWQQVGEYLKSRWPRLDLLVNNAGVCSSGEVGQMPLEEFRRVLDVNLIGVINGCHTLIPWLKQTGGIVINVASVFGVLAPPAMAAYNVSKAAVITLSETLYAELRSSGVGVTVAIPGFFSSQLIESGQFVDVAHRRIAEQFVRKSSVTAEDVARITLVAAKRRELYAVMGSKSRWYWRLKRLAPRSLAKLAAERFQRKIEKYGAMD